MSKAIGMIEFKTTATGVTAADAMVKTSDVEIVEAQTVCPGKYIAIITGDLSAVKAAVDTVSSNSDGVKESSLYPTNWPFSQRAIPLSAPWKENKKTFSFHLFRHCEIFHIACHRIEMLRNLPWVNILVSFPWILHIGILRCIVALHLDMGRHTDVIPVFAGIIFSLEAFYGISVIAA